MLPKPGKSHDICACLPCIRALSVSEQQDIAPLKNHSQTGSDVLCFIGENPGPEKSGPGLFFGVLVFGLALAGEFERLTFAC